MWNPAAERLFGWRADEVLGHPIPLIPEESRALADAMIKEQLKGVTYAGFDVANRRKDGSLVDVRLWTAPLRDVDGEILGVMGIFEDITERKRADAALQQRTHELRERIKELRCLYEVARFTQQTELPLEEVVQQTITTLASTYQYPEITCVRVEIKGREYQSANFRESPWCQASDIIVDGHRIGALEERSPADEGPFLKEERGLIGTVAGLLGRSVQDRRERAVLAESEQRFRTVVETVPEILYHAVLPSYAATFVSPAIESLLGFAPAEWEQALDIWTRQLHDEDRERVCKTGWEMAERRDRDLFRVEYRMWHKDGKTLRWLQGRVHIERDG